MENIPFLKNFDLDSIWTSLNEMVNNRIKKIIVKYLLLGL